jgi:hypothetical protein
MTDKIKTNLKADYLPILDGINFTNWLGRIKVHLRGKDIWNACTVPLNPLATVEEKEKYSKSNFGVIAIITPRLNARCYNEVVNKDTIDVAALLWKKIMINTHHIQSLIEAESSCNGPTSLTPEIFRTTLIKLAHLCLISNRLTSQFRKN